MPVPLIRRLVLRFQLLAKRLGPGQPTRDVVAHVNYGPGLRVGSEEMIEGDHTPSFCRRYGQAPADIIECAAANPTDPILNRVESWQQQVAPLLDLTQAASRNPCITFDATEASYPCRFRRTEQPIDGLPLFCAGLSPDDVQVHDTS